MRQRADLAEHGLAETGLGTAFGIEVPRQAIDQRRADDDGMKTRSLDGPKQYVPI